MGQLIFRAISTSRLLLYYNISYCDAAGKPLVASLYMVYISLPQIARPFIFIRQKKWQKRSVFSQIRRFSTHFLLVSFSFLAVPNFPSRELSAPFLLLDRDLLSALLWEYRLCLPSPFLRARRLGGMLSISCIRIFPYRQGREPNTGGCV